MKLSDSDETEIKSMIGDVNLFFTDNENRQKAELEVMISG